MIALLALDMREEISQLRFREEHLPHDESHYASATIQTPKNRSQDFDSRFNHGQSAQDFQVDISSHRRFVSDFEPSCLLTSTAASGSYVLQPGEILPCGLGLIPDAEPKRLSHNALRRWELAAKAIKRLRPERYNVTINAQGGISLLGRAGLKAKREDLLSSGLISPFVTCFLSIIYGGIHLTAWNYHFPSSSERLLWRMSGISTAVSFLTHWPLIMISPDITCGLIFMLLRWGLIAFFIFCRIFLVVEAFISLRRVPVGVYASVPWIQAIPHI